MKATKEVITTISLELTEQEATWLRTIMQNQIVSGVESPTSKRIREDLFNALREVTPITSHR